MLSAPPYLYIVEILDDLSCLYPVSERRKFRVIVLQTKLRAIRFWPDFANPRPEGRNPGNARESGVIGLFMAQMCDPGP